MLTNHLAQVHEGMRVFDRQHREIGKVDYVRLSDDDPTTPEVEAVVPARDNRRETILDTLADVFRPDNLPEEMRNRLLQQGFVRLDSAGLFEADRYITPDQIESVSGEEVVLTVNRDDLIKH